MKITLWGTRGSLPTPGKSTERYGGNTSCIEVRASDGSLLILDAGTGIRLLGNALGEEKSRIDLLLTHLHMDHIQGLGFFSPLYNNEMNVHIWGPPSTTRNLEERLALYLSPPLFPVRLRELKCRMELHDIPLGDFEIGPFKIKASIVCHPGVTMGFKISENQSSFVYMPDHEPALGCKKFPDSPEWTSGFELAAETDLLIHDAQYNDAEYLERIGWGHSSIQQAITFANAARAKRLILFHHDPMHDDQTMDKLVAEAQKQSFPFKIEAAREGQSYSI